MKAPLLPGHIFTASGISLEKAAHRTTEAGDFRITHDLVLASKMADCDAMAMNGHHAFVRPECGKLTGMRYHDVDIPMERIEAFCRANHIRRLALFGSILRDDFGPQSDIDVLVEFEPEARTGLAFFRMQRELAEMLGRRVDMNTPQELSRYFRDQVLREAEVLYVAA